MKIKNLFQEALENGSVEVQSGVWLVSKEQMIEDQKSWEDEDQAKNQDFSGSDFWLSADDGVVEEADYDSVSSLISN